MALHHSLDDRNAGITQGTYKIQKHVGRFRFAVHFIPLPTRTSAASYLWAVLPCRKMHLATYIQTAKVYLLEEKISAGDGFSRNRALAGSCR